MTKKPVIAEWWRKKNPAKDCLLDELNLKVTSESEKAIKFNNKFWIPKSAIEWKELSEEEKRKNKPSGEKEDVEHKLKLLANFRNLSVKDIKNHLTLKKDMPAMYVSNPSLKQMETTAYEIKRHISKDIRSQIRSEIKKEKGIVEAIKFLNTDEYIKKLYKRAIAELEKKINSQ